MCRRFVPRSVVCVVESSSRCVSVGVAAGCSPVQSCGVLFLFPHAVVAFCLCCRGAAAPVPAAGNAVIAASTRAADSGGGRAHKRSRQRNACKNPRPATRGTGALGTAGIRKRTVEEKERERAWRQLAHGGCELSSGSAACVVAAPHVSGSLSGACRRLPWPRRVQEWRETRVCLPQRSDLLPPSSTCMCSPGKADPHAPLSPPPALHCTRASGSRTLRTWGAVCRCHA